jgi:hypothetical protein
VHIEKTVCRGSLSTKNVLIECTATDLTRARIVLETVVAMFSVYCAKVGQQGREGGGGRGGVGGGAGRGGGGAGGQVEERARRGNLGWRDGGTEG